MKRFIEEKIAVKCETKEELKDFLKRCAKEHLNWANEKPADSWEPTSGAPYYITSGFNFNKAPKLEYSNSCNHFERNKWKVITYKEYFEQVFKVGDKVRIRNDLKVGKNYGKSDDTSITLLNSMKEYLGKVVTISRIKEGNLWFKGIKYWWNPEMVEPLEHETETITINRHGSKVVAKYGNKVGVAKCNPEDEFNFETGAKLAFERLFGTEVKEVNRGAKVGEYIKVVNPFMTAGKYKKDDIFKAKSVDNNYNVCVVEHVIMIRRDEYVVLEGYKPEPQKEPIAEKELFKPYLTKGHLNYGLIGEETNLTALFGETLFVGDVVEVFEEWSKNKTERYIVKSTEGFHVDCLEMSTINLKNGVCKDKIVHHSTYQVRKIKSYRDLQHNEQYLKTKVILKEDK